MTVNRDSSAKQLSGTPAVAARFVTREVLYIRPRAVAWALGVGTAALLVCYLLTTVYGLMVDVPPSGTSHTLVRFFDMDVEQSFPTWYSSAMLLVGSGIAYFVARTAERDRRYWLLIAGALAYLSLDETAMIHEAVPGGFEIPYLVILSILAVLCVPFIRRMHPGTRTAIALAGALYCFGAIALDYVAWHILTFARTSAIYHVFVAVEETDEKVAVTIVIVTLLNRLRAHTGGAFRLAANQDTVAPPM